jgi:acetyl esterase/lipase
MLKAVFAAEQVKRNKRTRTETGSHTREPVYGYDHYEPMAHRRHSLEGEGTPGARKRSRHDYEHEPVDADSPRSPRGDGDRDRDSHRVLFVSPSGVPDDKAAAIVGTKDATSFHKYQTRGKSIDSIVKSLVKYTVIVFSQYDDKEGESLADILRRIHPHIIGTDTKLYLDNMFHTPYLGNYRRDTTAQLEKYTPQKAEWTLVIVRSTRDQENIDTITGKISLKRGSFPRYFETVYSEPGSLGKVLRDLDAKSRQHVVFYYESENLIAGTSSLLSGRYVFVSSSYSTHVRINENPIRTEQIVLVPAAKGDGSDKTAKTAEADKADGSVRAGNYVLVSSSSKQSAEAEAYAKKVGKPLRIITPSFWKADSDKPTPLIFFIHGGGWGAGNRTSGLYSVLPNALKNGISVVSIEYRFISEATADKLEPPVKGPMMDAARALQFVRSKAREWNIDKTRVGASGGSAGACTSLWLAFHDDLADAKNSDPIARESTRLLCAAVTGPQTSLDPNQMREWTPNSSYGAHAFGITGDAATKQSNFDAFVAAREKILPWIAEYSPFALVSSDDPAVGLYFNNVPAVGQPAKDPTHSANFGLKLKEQCDAHKVSCELVYPGLEGVQHATTFDFLLTHLKR